VNRQGEATIPLAAQLYGLRREAEQDLGEVLDRVAKTGYLGVEMLWFHGMPPAELRGRLEDLQLKLVGWHYQLEHEEHLAAAVAGLDEQHVLGNDTVLASLGPPNFESPEALRGAIDRFNRFSEVVHERGMRLGYHNHWWEFRANFEGKSGMDTLLEEFDPRIFLEADTYWIQVGCGDLVGTLEAFGRRLKLLHLKDGPCTEEDPMTAVGGGEMDIPAAIAAAPQVEWHIVELDECATDMFQAVEDSYRYLVGEALSRGRSSDVPA
jgi:sugar phosphate isomerase/epimerase